MARIFFTKRQRKASVAATLGLVTLVFAGIAYLAAGPLFRVDALRNLWGHGDDMQIRLRLVTVALRLTVLGGGLTLVGLLHGLLSPRARLSGRGFIALILAAFLGWPIWHVYERARSSAPIHDISTDLQDPPPVDLPSVSGGHASRGGRDDNTYILWHQTSYASLTPRKLRQRPADALARAATAATILGWRVLSIDSKSGLMQATYTDDWFGFKTSLVVRVRAKDAGSLLDIRAVSDMAGGDWGTGARLINSLLTLMPS